MESTRKNGESRDRLRIDTFLDTPFAKTALLETAVTANPFLGGATFRATRGQPIRLPIPIRP
jgi:hypothetical protein